ncbi:hypothetical protein APHAL10511_003507 [Amanita phalloides]|nr:hypothetical protein APHAL10511_003507 [Amanita phalloides]
MSLPQPPLRWPQPLTPLHSPLPIHPHPSTAPLTPLPSPQRSPYIHPAFALSTHLVPAAHIRTTRFVPPPPQGLFLSPDDRKKLSKEEKLRKTDELRIWLLDARGADVEGKVGYERVLWNCVNRYYRVEPGSEREGKGLTLFFAHANGFPKEIWEPTLRRLLASSAHLVDEIWAWEAVQHGDAALVNREALSSVYDWVDNSRDILNFFTFFIPSSSASSSPLPTHLPRVPTTESDQRAIYGLPSRTIVGIGHSFGGCTTALAALFHPNLFSSLVLIDPVITMPFWPGTRVPRIHPDDLAVAALARRDGWSSRSEALALFEKNFFFAAWHPDVLRIYVECALYPASDPSQRSQPQASSNSGPVIKLKMPPLHEGVVFAERHTSGKVFVNLSKLDDKIRLRWIIPGVDNPIEMGPPQQRVWLRPTNSSNIKIPNASHLIAQEKPKELADEIRQFLHDNYSTTTLRARM